MMTESPQLLPQSQRLSPPGLVLVAALPLGASGSSLSRGRRSSALSSHGNSRSGSNAAGDRGGGAGGDDDDGAGGGRGSTTDDAAEAEPVVVDPEALELLDEAVPSAAVPRVLMSINICKLRSVIVKNTHCCSTARNRSDQAG